MSLWKTILRNILIGRKNSLIDGSVWNGFLFKWLHFESTSLHHICYLCFIFSIGSKSYSHPYLRLLWWIQQDHLQRSRCWNSSLSKSKFRREALFHQSVKDAFMMNQKRVPFIVQKVAFMTKNQKRVSFKVKKKKFFCDHCSKSFIFEASLKKWQPPQN